MFVGCAQGGEETSASNEKPGFDAGVTDATADAHLDASQDITGWDAVTEATSEVDAPIDAPTGDSAQGDVASEPPPPSACGVQGGLALALVNRQVIRDDAVEAAVDVPAGHVITGLGLRINSDDVKTLRVRSQALLSDGSLGAAQEQRAGDEPSGSLEADLDLPPCYVAVGAATRSNDDNARTLVVWAAPMASNGSLGAVEEFRAGSEPDAGVEIEYQSPVGRVLTGVGFRVDGDDMAGMRAVTDGWVVQ